MYYTDDSNTSDDNNRNQHSQRFRKQVKGTKPQYYTLEIKKHQDA